MRSQLSCCVQLLREGRRQRGRLHRLLASMPVLQAGLVSSCRQASLGSSFCMLVMAALPAGVLGFMHKS